MKNVVTIGGGTRSFVLLSGLKKYPIKLSAIVSMADDGGSTGILRDELGVLPPGDVRQCLVALSDSSDILRRLMNYRFNEGGLDGHSFGNIFLGALEKINGSFFKGVEDAGKILNAKGKVIPVTDKDTNLKIILKNEVLLKGENEINHNFFIEKIGIKKNYLEPKANANPQAIKKILEADLIIIGPGNHYCSIIPNFLVDGISEAICRSKAKVVYNCNLVNKKGHTEKFDLDDYANDINKYIGKERIDFATFNTKIPGKKLIKKYENQKNPLVKFDCKKNPDRNFRVVQADFLSGKNILFDKADKISGVRSFIRHDSEKLAKILVMIMELGDYENIIKNII
ncbi:MAG: hypothetical protein COZ85_03000 [Candidatus Moranbacteria bacterium CG_4_8_14_3_um_filter_34_16]|nr:MAG: hypothetical protein COZ85_03000 [Candidatus Moranbacteria bacterium CG_4_8_14_3_um_filter_34_16]